MKSSAKGKGGGGATNTAKAVLKKEVLGKRNRTSSKSPSAVAKKTKVAVAKADDKVNDACDGCLEENDEKYELPCGHSFCKVCIRGLFVAALNDQSFLPVKCCGKRVDQRLRRVVLTLDECDQFESTLEEFEAPNQLFWYAALLTTLIFLYQQAFLTNSFLSNSPRKECSTFHNLDKVASSSTGRFLCSGCATPLCAKCRASHPKVSCAEYNSLPQNQRSVEDLLFFNKAKRARYARCAACSRFIERSEGCRHMICRCGHQFSYGEERYKGINTEAKGASMQKAVVKPVRSAFVEEEADCEHEWTPYNSAIEGSLLCHLCRKSKCCYQTACAKCYRRACPACQKKMS